MKLKLFEFPVQPILIEQARLALGNLAASLFQALSMIALLVWTLSDGNNNSAMLIWGTGAGFFGSVGVFHARRTLASGLSGSNVSRLLKEMFVLNALMGLAWGMLPVAALNTQSIVNSVLIVAVIAGVGANGISLFSSVYPLFLAFVIPEFAPLEFMLLKSGGHEFIPLILCIGVYLLLLIMYARNNYRSALTSITLRFENLDLIGRLREESARAEEANQAKSKFLAAASHDLRQPIHALGLYLDALNRPELSLDQRQALVSKAMAVSEATSEILNALLDFSRIEAGVIEPQIHTFQLQPLLNKIESELAPQADAKELFYRTRETHLAVETDPVLLKLMLRNLVINAIRYTKRGGILIACRKRGDFVQLEVWDTGIGIAASQQQEIFKEFHQLGNSERDHRKGLGLGLSIVDRLARQLNIPLAVASTPQRGSVFRLRLPIAREAVAINDFDTPRVNTVHHFHARVLVIDDEEAVRDGMLHLLRDWGCECMAVESADAALEATCDFVPDILISDYRLRDHRTGAEAIHLLRARFGQDLPALLITGDTAPERLREALSSGVPLLHKPVSPIQLNQSVYEQLAAKGKALASG